MKENIETLEILRDVNDELQENHVEYERELVSEIEFKDSLLAECQQRNLIQQDLVEDKETTMVKFRGLVAELSAELETIKAPLKAHDLLGDDEEGSRSQKQMLVSVNLQLHASDLKVRKLGNLLLVKNMQYTYASELADLLQVWMCLKLNSLIFLIISSPTSLNQFYYFYRLRGLFQLVKG
jgi:dynactin 1